MDLKKANLTEGKVKFLFMQNNRSVSQNKALRESILKNGVLQPITVIRVADVDDDIMLIDGGQTVSKKGNENAFVIIDGQHRYTELSDIVDKMKQGKYQGMNINTTLHYNILTKSEVGNVNSYVIEMNSHSRNWNSTDYIENANKVCNDDILIRVINRFKEKKFSMSAISRFVCFNVKSLTNETLAAYVNSNGKTPIRDADADRAIKLYLFLHYVGFTDDFMRKRYLIDYVIRDSKVNGIDSVLAKIRVLKRGSEISTLRDKDGDISSTMERMIGEDFKKYIKDKSLNQDSIDELAKKDHLSDYDADDIADFFSDEPLGNGEVDDEEEKETKSKIVPMISADRCLTLSTPKST